MRHHIIAVSFACLMAAAITADAAEEVWIPAAASNPGLHGTTWTTDLWLQSRVIGAPMEITAAFFAYRAGTPSPSETTIVLQPGEHRQIVDAVATLFGEDRPGAIRLRSDDPFFAQSRTANDGGDAGSFGQGIPAFPVDAASMAMTFLGAANRPGDDGIRTNIGIVNTTDQPGTVTIFARDSRSLEDLGSESIEIGPYGWFQDDVFELLGADARSIDLADVSVLGPQGLLGYLSRVDNRSGDGTFIAASVGEFVTGASGPWEVVATLTYDGDAVVELLEYTWLDDFIPVEDPPSGFTTGPLYVDDDGTFCVNVTGEAGPGNSMIEIAIDRRLDGDSWFRGRHRRSWFGGSATEPIAEEYCVELN